MRKKMRKKNQPKKTPPIEDRISALPDEILSYILSFFPTKFAFTTSVLSKRWNSICNSLPVLHFDFQAENDIEAFILFCRFVDNVLLSPHVQDQPIETLSIACKLRLPGCPPFNAEVWIEASKRRRVVNLHVSAGYFSIPPSVFTSQTLVVLKLIGVEIDHEVGSVELPSVTTLHLIGVFFKKKDDVKKVLNACPGVVDLHATTCSEYLLCYTTGYKIMPNVVKAKIRTYNVPFSAIYNVESLSIQMVNRRPKDQYIDSYHRAMPVFQNLISLELSFYLFPSWVEVVEVLPYCPKLQSLAIDKVSNELGYQKDWEYTKPVPECVSKAIADAEYEINIAFATEKVARRKEKEAEAAQKEANISLSRNYGTEAA
ncbi:FBD-associated F-box protein At4g10400-like [Lotus japonicus]|uniref:FBD-associated F-box protein At4g10400-like n=1 Tax=Lotus japonicus TaxID=34305 RepID=UPI002583EC53|nr:FBD-associated F-box protein At4g10400-like [Lotus japonicus]